VLVRNVSIFSLSLGLSDNQSLQELVLGAGNRVMGSIYWKMVEKVVISKKRVARFLYYYAKFYRRYTGLLYLYETYRFFLFLWVYLKTKGFWSWFGVQGTWLCAQYIWKLVKRRSFRRSAAHLLLCKVLKAIYWPIVLIRNVSIFPFSACFSKNQRLLEFVLGAGNRVLGSMYWKLGEKAVIL